MVDRFSYFPNQFPYRTKALFVFEEIDGAEVCFFGMHVQEYGSDCPAPNTRYVHTCTFPNFALVLNFNIGLLNISHF